MLMLFKCRVAILLLVLGIVVAQYSNYQDKQYDAELASIQAPVLNSDIAGLLDE